MRPFQNACCSDDDEGRDCEQTLVRARLEVLTEASNKISSFSVSDLYQHGQQVHAIRLEIIDEDGHGALLTMPPMQLEQVAKWLTEKASYLRRTSAEAGEAR